MANTDLMSPILRRAILRAQPDFFSWDEAARERFGLDLPDEAEFAIEREVLKSAFGRDFPTSDALRAHVRELDEPELSRFNEILLPLRGVGPNAVWLNEFTRDGSPFDRFATLRDYDESAFDYQVEAHAKEAEPPVRYTGPYRGHLYHVSAWALIERRIAYLTYIGAWHWLEDALIETSSAILKELVPHGHKRDFLDALTPVTGGYLLDREIDAGGKEGLLDELQHRGYARTLALFEETRLRLDGEAAGCCMKLRNDDWGAPSLTYVLTDKTAAGRIRMRNMVEDAEALPDGTAYLQSLRSELADRLSAGLLEDFEALKDVPESDMPVRKRAVVISARALDDISKI